MNDSIKTTNLAAEQTPIFSLDAFWVHRLQALAIQQITTLKGWQQVHDPMGMFKEAPLYLSDEFSSEFTPLDSPMLLVSAPGAVGKTTLAKQVAYRTGAIYVDLAQSEPVGGHTLSGSLVRAGMYEPWKEERTTVLLDGLDEARLRVTQEAFEAFLADILELSLNRNIPTVVFGRSGSIQEAWYALAEREFEAPVLEIGYYSIEDAIEFTQEKLRVDNSERLHPDTDKRAISLLLERIRSQTESDGDRFAGYAPVLQAVAEQVGKEGNPAALVADIERGKQPVTLQHVATSILERERTKLEPLSFENPNLAQVLYLADEQLGHLSSKVYGERSVELPQMSPADAKTYENALKTWVDDHPFLDGSNRPSSAVFGAAIATWTMHHSRSAEAVERAIEIELAKGMAANPFLSEIYMNELAKDDEIYIPPEHIGVVYASLRARLSLGDTASMLIEGTDGAEEKGSIRAEVEITQLRRHEKNARVVELSTDGAGLFRLGPHVEDVEVVAPESCLEIGPSIEVVLVAPVSVQCDLLSMEASTLIVEPSQNSSIGSVYLEAKEFNGHKLASVPTLRGSATLGACWPNVRNYPWTSFAIEGMTQDDPRIAEALRRLRKFVISFRSHSRGSLARFKGKIEHRRMTKGTGQAVLDLMRSEEIVSVDDSMYFLNVDRLSEETALSYLDCMEFRFGAKAVEFVRRAI